MYLSVGDSMLASSEGILCEPASAASVAGLIQAHSQGLVKQGSNIVCILTGNGLKDPKNVYIESRPPPTIIATPIKL